MKKIQFRYDGSDEAKKCIEWINDSLGYIPKKLFGNMGEYYSSDKYRCFSIFPDYTLLNPTEFLREVTGEWMPTVGEMYQFYGCGKLRKGIYKTKIGDWYVLDEDGDVATTKTMQKYYTVEENIQGYIQTYYSTYIPSDGIQKIIEMVKGGEGR